MRRIALQRRFVLAIALFTTLILAIWFGYYILSYDSASSVARENAELTAGRLLDQLGAEFSQIKSITGVIAGSSYVQDFLAADTTEAHYSKAASASEVIRNAVYPNLPTSNVISINSAGKYYRFVGGLSNAACETLYSMIHEAGTLYTVVELDGVLFFCHSAPVYSVSGQAPNRVGSVALLTHLSKKRTALSGSDAPSGIDTAVIQNNIILLSSNEELEGSADAELDLAYGLVVRMAIEGTDLTVAAAVKSEALFPGRTLFVATSVILLIILLIAVAVLFRRLSNDMVKPMTSVIGGVAILGGELRGRLPELPVIGKPDFESLVLAINGMLDRTERYSNELLTERQKLFDAQLAQRDMRIWLLTSQIDAHFVVNTITTIHDLAERGDHEKAKHMVDGLAQIMKHRHNGDAPCNLFYEFEMMEPYIDIMNIWYEDKFKVEYDVDDRLAAYLIPGLILQPVVENAMVHGLQNKEGEIALRICGYMEENAIILEVSDNGVGITPDKLREIRDALEKTETSNLPEPGLSGVALSNIQRRIRLRFGDGYGLSIDSAHGEGTTVTIRLPANPDET